MPDANLTQAEADALLVMPKIRVSEAIYKLPDLGGSICIPLASQDKRENFHLDLKRGRIDLVKNRYQNRVRQTIILVRLDIGGAPHRNPDDEEIACPHVHLYREGFSDMWAYAVNPEIFPNTNDFWATLERFMDFCNIVEPPRILRGLYTC